MREVGESERHTEAEFMERERKEGGGEGGEKEREREMGREMTTMALVVNH